MKIHRIPDPSYFRTVDLVIGSEKELDGWLKRQDPEDGWGLSAGRWARFDDRMHHYILIAKRGTRHGRIAVLGHELLHLTFAVMADAGLRLSDDSDEAFTYYFQGMFERCLKYLR
jgi:hypothetical protein